MIRAVAIGLMTALFTFPAAAGGIRIPDGNTERRQTQDYEFRVAVETSTRMEICTPVMSPISMDRLRTSAIAGTAEISGRPVNEILVELNKEIGDLKQWVLENNTLDAFCNQGGGLDRYKPIRLAEQATEQTKDAAALLERVFDERRRSKIALGVCSILDLSDSQRAETKTFIDDSIRWSYSQSEVCRQGNYCHLPDQRYREMLKELPLEPREVFVREHKKLCKAHTDFLSTLKDHPIYAEVSK